MIFDVFRKSGTAVSRVLTPHDLERVIASVSNSETGIAVNQDTASRLGTAFACIRVRAESLGQLPLHLYKTDGRSKVKDVENPLYSLLHDAPNEAMTATEFWEWVSVCFDTYGNAYSYINRLKNGDLFEILPLNPANVQVKRDQKGDIFYLVRFPQGDSGYGEQKRYEPKDILHFRAMSLNGGLTGASPIEHARETFGFALALEKHGAAFFRNGASPGGILKTDQVLTEETYNRLKGSWDDRQGGIEKAHRTALLEAGVSWQAVGITLKDAQFLEGRKFTRTEICGLFRVPPHLIADLERATFSNIEQQTLDYVIHGMQPMLRRIEQRISLQLLPKEQRSKFFAKFNVNGLARGDMAARSSYYTSQLQNGALSPNEIRELEDMNPRDGGDIYLTPLNMAVNGKPPAGTGTGANPADTGTTPPAAGDQGVTE